jgi:N-acetyl-1-D-myo-inositol-2-amino-2-deoxy-alpha-D-glucopyranoside deacetylase
LTATIRLDPDIEMRAECPADGQRRSVVDAVADHQHAVLALSLSPSAVATLASLLIAPLLPLTIWAAMVLYATELGVPTVNVTPFRRVLAVFPHPDDEAVSCGGTLRRLATGGATVTLLVLTHGERGTRDGSVSAELAQIRAAEARRAARALGVSELALEDLGDGRLRAGRDRLAALLHRTLARTRPDLVITYDRAGLYGHDDHVVCSAVLTELVPRRCPDARLWYVTPARRLQAFVPLPEALRERRSAPTHRLLVCAQLAAKTGALLAHRSQRRPAWLLLSILPFEHFTDAAPAVPAGSRRPPAPRPPPRGHGS